GVGLPRPPWLSMTCGRTKKDGAEPHAPTDVAWMGNEGGAEPHAPTDLYGWAKKGGAEPHALLIGRSCRQAGCGCCRFASRLQLAVHRSGGKHSCCCPLIAMSLAYS